MRKIFVTLCIAALLGGPAALAQADPIIQPLRCRVGDMTGVYVGGKCSGPY